MAYDDDIFLTSVGFVVACHISYSICHTSADSLCARPKTIIKGGFVHSPLSLFGGQAGLAFDSNFAELVGSGCSGYVDLGRTAFSSRRAFPFTSLQFTLT